MALIDPRPYDRLGKTPSNFEMYRPGGCVVSPVGPGYSGAYDPGDEDPNKGYPEPKTQEKFADKVAFKSGATSSGKHPRYRLMPGVGMGHTADRFNYGNEKHEFDNPVLAEANWLKAFHARDVEFFWDRWAHAIDHMWNEIRGIDDKNPGGNLGAIGWFQETFAFVKKYDPTLYAAIQGKIDLADQEGDRQPCACPFCQ